MSKDNSNSTPQRKPRAIRLDNASAAMQKPSTSPKPPKSKKTSRTPRAQKDLAALVAIPDDAAQSISSDDASIAEIVESGSGAKNRQKVLVFKTSCLPGLQRYCRWLLDWQ